MEPEKKRNERRGKRKGRKGGPGTCRCPKTKKGFYGREQKGNATSLRGDPGKSDGEYAPRGSNPKNKLGKKKR